MVQCGLPMFNSHAITKIQSVILICIIVVASVGGTIAYVLLNEEETSEPIKIGFLEDLDSFPNILGMDFLRRGYIFYCNLKNGEIYFEKKN